jgi:hypothetical protein
MYFKYSALIGSYDNKVAVNYFLFLLTTSPVLRDVKLAELNGVPGPVESTMTINGRQCAKLSGDPYTFSGVGKTLSDLTWPYFQDKTS